MSQACRHPETDTQHLESGPKAMRKWRGGRMHPHPSPLPKGERVCRRLVEGINRTIQFSINPRNHTHARKCVFPYHTTSRASNTGPSVQVSL